MDEKLPHLATEAVAGPRRVAARGGQRDRDVADAGSLSRGRGPAVRKGKDIRGAVLAPEGGVQAAELRIAGEENGDLPERASDASSGGRQEPPYGGAGERRAPSSLDDGHDDVVDPSGPPPASPVAARASRPFS